MTETEDVTLHIGCVDRMCAECVDAVHEATDAVAELERQLSAVQEERNELNEALGEAVRLISMTFVYLVADPPLPERRVILGNEATPLYYEVA